MNDNALPQGPQAPGDEPAASDTSDQGGLYAGYEKERAGVNPGPPQKQVTGSFLHRLLAHLHSNDAAVKQSTERAASSGMEDLSLMGRATGLGLGRLGVAGATAVSHITGGQTPEEKANLSAESAQLDAYYKHGEEDHAADFGANLIQTAGAVTATLAGGAGLLAGGFAIDAFGFDPYKPGLAELMAKMPGENNPARVIREAGKNLSVKPDDPYANAIIKRGIVGAGAGRFIDWGLHALVLPTMRFLAQGSEAAAVLRNPASTAAERTVAEEAVVQADNGLVELRDGTHTPPEAKVVARTNGDGTWTPEAVYTKEEPIHRAYQDPTTGEVYIGDSHSDARDAWHAGTPDRGTAPVHGMLTNRNRFIPTEKLTGFLREADAEAAARTGAVTEFSQMTPDELGAELTRLTQKGAVRDALAEKGVVPDAAAQVEAVANERRLVTLQGEISQRMRAGEHFPPRGDAGADAFQRMRMDRPEAEAQASTMDATVRGEEQRNGRVVWSEEDVATHQDMVERIRTAESPEAAMAELHASDPFNLDTMRDVNDFRTQQRALAARFGEEFRTLRQRVPVNVTLQIAEDFARKVGLREWADQMRHLNSEDGLVESVKMVLNSRAVEQAGERMGQLSALRISRPHDPAVLMEMRRMGDIWFDLSMEVAGARSEWGRTGRIIQEMRTAQARKVRFQNDVKVRTQGQTAVREARAEIAKAPAPDVLTPGDTPDVPTSSNDTKSVNASDFSLARARAAAEKVQNALDEVGSDYPTFQIDEAAATERATEIRKQADLQRADPLAPPTAAEKAAAAAETAKRKPPVNPIEELSKWLDGAEKELDKVSNRAAANATKRDVTARAKAGTAFDENLRQNETPVDAAKRAGKAANERAAAFDKQDGMKLFGDMPDAEVEQWARMFQRAGGKVRNVQAVLNTLKEETAAIAEEAAAKTKPEQVMEGTQTLFIANLISGLKTAESIATSGAAMNAFRAAGKVLAGAGTMDQHMLEEGAAQFYALARFSKENVASAASAFREARGVMDGAPRVYLQGGVTKTAIQLPGRIAGTLDEFTRVAAYRAEEYAKAFRQAREAGLDITAAAKQAEGDVKFSLKDGIALNDQARKLAGIPTLSDALGHDTAMGLIAAGLNKVPLGKLAVPFVRPSVNTYRFFAQNTPGINLFNSEARRIMAEGGSEAVQLHARSVIAGSMMLYTGSEFMQGNVTGSGPKDPMLRALWMRDHQQYSWKIGGDWVSYRRMEPFASWIGLVADATEAYLETDDDGNHGDIMYAVFSAMAKNTYNKSWTQGLSDLLTAAASGDKNTWSRWGGGIAEGFAVPMAVQQANGDPYYREARGVVDRIRSKTPGLSESMSPRYEFDGSPMMKQHVLWNNLTMFPRKSAAPDFVADELIKNNIKIGTYPARQFKGQFDMLDPKWEKNGTLPYNRFMEILKSKDISGKMEQTMKSPAWDKMSPGTPTYPGGEREREIKRIKDEAEQDALDKVFHEWKGTGLGELYDRLKYELPQAARWEGPDRENALREKYKIPVPSR